MSIVRIFEKIECIIILHCTSLISPWKKWPSFCRRNFHMHFDEWKFCTLIKISPKFVPKGPIDNNGLVPNRRQAIIWTNDDPIHRCIYAALRRDGLIPFLETLLGVKSVTPHLPATDDQFAIVARHEQVLGVGDFFVLSDAHPLIPLTFRCYGKYEGFTRPEVR